MNKKMLIALLCSILVLTACQSKVPDGVSEDFYNDVKGILNNLINTVQKHGNDNNIVEILENHSDYEKLSNLYKDQDNLSMNEVYIIDYTWILYENVILYYSGSINFKKDIIEVGNILCDLMGVKLDVQKLIK